MTFCKQDCRCPDGHLNDLTANERAWIEFLRLIANGRDPAPRLRDVQLLRRLLQRHGRRAMPPVERRL